jgi:L-fucose isomerase-like protein
MADKIKIGFVPASRGFFSQALAKKMRSATIAAMKKAGLAPVTPGPELCRNGLVESHAEAMAAAALLREQGVAGVVVGAVNFGNEVPAAEAAIAGAAGAPILLFGCKEDGKLTPSSDRRDAFCGLLSIATALRHRGARYTFPRVANTFPEDAEFGAELADFGAVCRVIAGVRGAVYGQIGPRPREFETCAFDELALLHRFGIKVVPLPLSELFGLAEKFADAKRIARTVKSFSKTADLAAARPEALERLARLELVLRDKVAEFGMKGLAIQCWTSIQTDYGASPCLIMGRLDDDGIPAACEVDVHGTVSMHLLALAAGRASALADWNNRHYQRDNVFSAWHCGVFPASFSAGRRALSYHKIVAADVGADNAWGTVELETDPGPVTMTRLTQGPDGSWKLLVCEGKVVPAEGETFGGNAWVEVKDLDRLYRALLRDFPHHVAIVPGHVARIVETAAYFLGIETVTPLGSAIVA